tara:strand:- start:10103 stop:10486 length:384 start_codon:yes stop_codon:yes gene_type:complete
MSNQNYMSPAIEARLLQDSKTLDVAANVAEVSSETAPVVATTGNSVVHLYGRVSVTTGAANMGLATLPGVFASPAKQVYVAVPVDNAGTFKTGYVLISGLIVSAVGTPLDADVYHLDNICYIANPAS